MVVTPNNHKTPTLSLAQCDLNYCQNLTVSFAIILILRNLVSPQNLQTVLQHSLLFCIILWFWRHNKPANPGLMDIFPGGPGSDSTRMSPICILLELRMTTGVMAWKAPVKLSPPTKQHPTFYGLYDLPVTQQMVSKQRKVKNYKIHLCVLNTYLKYISDTLMQQGTSQSINKAKYPDTLNKPSEIFNLLK